jgi:hypothetical protein
VHREYHAGFTGERTDRLGGSLGETLGVPEYLFESWGRLRGEGRIGWW